VLLTGDLPVCASCLLDQRSQAGAAPAHLPSQRAKQQVQRVFWSLLSYGLGSDIKEVKTRRIRPGFH